MLTLGTRRYFALPKSASVGSSIVVGEPLHPTSFALPNRPLDPVISYCARMVVLCAPLRQEGSGRLRQIFWRWLTWSRVKVRLKAACSATFVLHTSRIFLVPVHGIPLEKVEASSFLLLSLPIHGVSYR